MTSPRATLTRYAEGFIRASCGCADQSPRGLGEPAVQADEVRLAQDVLQGGQPHAERLGLPRVGVGE